MLGLDATGQPRIPAPGVKLVCHRFLHHGSRSGYHQLARHIQADAVLTSRLTWALSLGGRIAKLHAHLNALTDLEVAPHLLGGRRKVFHHLYPENTMRFLPLWKGRHKVVATVHQPPEALDRWIGPRRRLYERVDGFIALCASQEQYLRSAFPHAAVARIPHGVDIAFFRPPSGSEAAAEKDRPAFTCLTVGNWMRDFDLLREVAVLMAADRDVRFRIVALPRFREAFRSCPNVEFLCGLSDLQMLDAFRTADLLLLPMLDAAANNALNEGMACGLPVLASDLPALREYAGDEAAAWINGRDTRAFAEAIRGLRADPERRRRMGMAARRSAEAIAWPGVAARVAEFYRAFLRDGPTSA